MTSNLTLKGDNWSYGNIADSWGEKKKIRLLTPQRITLRPTSTPGNIIAAHTHLMLAMSKLFAQLVVLPRVVLREKSVDVWRSVSTGVCYQQINEIWRSVVNRWAGQLQQAFLIHTIARDLHSTWQQPTVREDGWRFKVVEHCLRIVGEEGRKLIQSCKVQLTVSNELLK